ncbi:MAG: NAD(P)/FAD-dependent oxidoreductase [Synergistaceae bacterium]|nr:NAD(P)/FAD-dependent oxidoreductase [Synergistaceae bacterium]
MDDISNTYEVVIIGAGVTGCCIARELSKFQVSACVIEKGDDVASGTSKGNSGVIHSGFDAKPGSLMAQLNTVGNRLMWEKAEELDFPVKMNGALVVCTNENERDKLDALLDQGIKNGVPGVRILERGEVLEMEPNLTDKTVAALYAPTGGVICPFNLAIAMAENANINGVEFRLETEALSVEKTGTGYRVRTNRGDISAVAVVNAAGVYADKFHNMVSGDKIRITARKGEYLLFDKILGDIFRTSVFPLPGAMGKGVLTAPTIHGNLYVGPSANDVEDKEAVNTTKAVLDDLADKVRANHLCKVPLPLNKVINSFSGLRPHEDRHDFIIGEPPDAERFFDAAGIESPGLTCSPAIGEMLSEIIAEKMSLPKKDRFISKRRGVTRFDHLTREEKKALVREAPRYGNVVCRCETITEGEILDAIHRPLGARSLDSVKRRTRAGMGRCQGGFCTPKVMAILSRELGIKMSDVTKKGSGSWMVTECDK